MPAKSYFLTEVGITVPSSSRSTIFVPTSSTTNICVRCLNSSTCSTKTELRLIKFWFSISKDEQMARFESRKDNPLKQWKLSPIDARAQELWDKYTHYKELMFSKTHTTFSPWIIVRANTKKTARLESIRHVLSSLDYDGKENTLNVIDTGSEHDPAISPFSDKSGLVKTSLSDVSSDKGTIGNICGFVFMQSRF